MIYGIESESRSLRAAPATPHNSKLPDLKRKFPAHARTVNTLWICGRGLACCYHLCMQVLAFQLRLCRILISELRAFFIIVAIYFQASCTIFARRAIARLQVEVSNRFR